LVEEKDHHIRRLLNNLCFIWIGVMNQKVCFGFNYASYLQVLNVQHAGFIAAVIHNVDSDMLVQMHGTTSTQHCYSICITETLSVILCLFCY